MPQSDEVLKHVFRITEQRDHDLLSKTLLTSVREMLRTSLALHLTLDKDYRPLRVARLDDQSFVIETENPSADPRLVTAISGLDEDSESTLPCIELDDQVVGFELTYSDPECLQYLCFFRASPYAEHELHILSGMLRVYGNFLSLLTDSQTDELTRLANRKTFENVVTQVFELGGATTPQQSGVERRHESEGEKRFWLVMLDVDNFKRINDEFGHLYGDEILIHLASLIRDGFRQNDHKFRFGGEEFVVLLEARDRSDCARILDRFLSQVRHHEFPRGLSVTMSLGVVEFKREVFHVTSLDHADRALYHSKSQGKDRYTFYEDLVSEGLVEKQGIEGGEIDLF